jgi:hypothetical protein
MMENHPTSPFKGKDQQRRDGLNSSFAGPPARRVTKPAHLPTSSETSLRGFRNTSGSPEASALMSRTQADPRQPHCLARALEAALSVFDSPKTGL